MNMKFILLLSLLTACGGSLSQEERQKLKDGMVTQDIRRVTDAELQEAAMAFGSEVIRDIERVDRYLLKKAALDSLAQARGVIVFSLTRESAAAGVERDLTEAYVAGAVNGTAIDNLQELGNDSLLFTRPVLKLHPDGSQEFSHAIGIRIAKRTVILSMPQP